MKSYRPKPAKRKARSRPKKRDPVGDWAKSDTPTLGENIKRARTAANLTQLALAHQIGYQGDDAGAYISRVESNHQAPRIDTLQRIADALGVPVCSLLSKS